MGTAMTTEIRSVFVFGVVLAMLAIVVDSTLGSIRILEQQDLFYYEGANAHSSKHKLNLFVPADGKGHPVILFVHGGSWRRGDKDDFGGAYSQLGRSLASEGIAVAVINYRLTPDVRHPEHARDVARAVSWIHYNAADHGLDSRKIVLMGHSAGAHLCSLVAMDSFYLEEQGVTPEIIRGVVSVSGVYDLTRTGVTGQLLYADVFGIDEQQLKEASPTFHVGGSPAPFLLLYAEDDYPTADFQTRRFASILDKSGGSVRILQIFGRNHVNIISGVGKNDDPVRNEIVNFLMEIFPLG